MNTRDLKQFWKKAHQDLIFTQATALAYTTVVSLVPILAVAFFLFHAFGGFDNLLDKITPLIEQNLAPSFSQQISSYLNGFIGNAHAGAVGLLGVIGFIFTSVSTLATIENTFNLVWGVKKKRGWPQRVTAYWSVLTIGPLLLGVSIALTSKVSIWLHNDNGAISHLLVWSFAIVPYLLSGLLFSGLFIFMPNVPVHPKDAFKAGAITGVVFEIAKLLYAGYATFAISNNSIYGSLAIIPLFLLWVYVIWLIVLFGAELCCYFQFRRVGIPYKFDDDERLSLFLLTDILEELSKTQKIPGGGMTLHELLGTLKIPLRELVAHLDFLEESGWVVGSSQSLRRRKKYILAVSLDKIDVGKILTQLGHHRYIPRSTNGLAIHEKLKGLWAGWRSALK